MAFGYNRYVLVLAMLAAASAAGCGDKKSKKNFGSTVAPATSGTTAPTTSSTAPIGPGPILISVNFEDVAQNNMVSPGDKLILHFSNEVAPVATGADPAQEFVLAVAGDSFGTNATLQNSTQPYQLEIVLGDAPVLRVTGDFDIGRTQPGSASGLNVAAGAMTAGIDAGEIQPAAAPLDVAGTLQAGFRPAGNLVIARGGHSATSLDDGRVLIVGGVAGGSKAGNYVADAELYDPVTNDFTLVSDLSGEAGRMMRGSIPVAAVNATAVALNDGTVLISGGYGVERRGLFGIGKAKVDTLDSAFIFDPTDNSFRRVGDMKYSRHSHTATIMDDGRVLIAGGYSEAFWSSDKTQAPFEIYDPAQRAFSKAGSIFSRFKSKEPRMNHTATAIDGGTGILLTGGNYYKGGHLFGLIKPKLHMTKGSEVVRGTNTDRSGDLNQARMSHAASALTSREVMVAGGYDMANIVGSIEVYNAASGQWTASGSLATPRTGAAIAVDRQSALIIGGTDGTSEIASVEVFNADAKQLSQSTFTLAAARNAFTATKLSDGRILVVGGMSGATKSLQGLDGQAMASAEIYASH